MSEHIDISEGGWKSHDGVPEHSCRKPANWGFWPKVTCLYTPGRYQNNQKLTKGPLVDKRPKKIAKTEKFRLFDTFLMEISSITNDWSVSFEYNDKRISVINLIVHKDPVLRNLPYTKLTPFQNLIPQ